MSDIFERIAAAGIVPVIAIDSPAHALPLADALLEGGISVAEITFRTSAAAEVIAIIAQNRPEMLTGAGTVLTTKQVDQSLEAGANFALAPGFDAEIVIHARQKGLQFAPAIMTPSDISVAMRHSCNVMKFFPAMPAGGPDMLKNISAPFKHLSPRFIPTGGVTAGNMPDWLALPEVIAVGGTWIARPEDMANGDWAGITSRARNAMAALHELRAARQR